MNSTVLRMLAWTSLLPLCFGCQPWDKERLNSPPQGEQAPHPDWNEDFCYMNDQGMLWDSSIADIHFVPHRAELSGTGIARLERYAELMATSGGTIRYTTSSKDNVLVQARLASAQEFLSSTMPEAKPIQVVLGLPGGRGMGAKESVAGAAIAEQPEPRQDAYHLETAGGFSTEN